MILGSEYSVFDYSQRVKGCVEPLVEQNAVLSLFLGNEPFAGALPKVEEGRVGQEERPEMSTSERFLCTRRLLNF